MNLQEPIAVTGPGGRLGRAIVESLAERGMAVIRAERPHYDLDDATAAGRLIETHHPRTVIHAAAWTDVEGCAAQPDLAMRRNGTAVQELAEVCVAADATLVLISTNEVFDGQRDDGRGYAEDDPPGPVNPYGATKLSGEQAARAAYSRDDGAGRLWIIRTAWLFGPPGNDFPSKIIAAADRLASGEDLRVVSDEVGSPSYTIDLAPALLDLVVAAPAGTYHLVGGGVASRFEVAREVIASCRPAVRIAPISRSEFPRTSTAPAWAVLDTGRARSFGISTRAWPAALSSYLGQLCPASAPT